MEKFQTFATEMAFRPASLTILRLHRQRAFLGAVAALPTVVALATTRLIPGLSLCVSFLTGHIGLRHQPEGFTQIPKNTKELVIH